MSDSAPLCHDAQWYKDAVIYQLHVKSFFDANNDGTGDFPGLIQKLDYLAELGVTALWLLPFYPSPRRDDGYDISDYLGVHPDYGSIADVRALIDQAHARGLKIITELVINHTSDQHAWFQRARRSAPGSPERNYYVWSDDDKRYANTRIIFLDTEKSNWTWDEVAKAYYWHRFYSHQPDLNFDNPAVMQEVLSVLRFWLDMGVDGLRLDAVPYLVESEGTNNENLPETHAILKRIRAEVDAHYQCRMLLAEANQWPEDVQHYFGDGDGDECHMLFHFPLMPRMYMAIAQEDRFPITDIIRQTPDAPPSGQWAIFLRNHDELTLEMVTDKERDYLWKTYAADARARLNLGIRRRLSPLLQRDRRRVELMNAMLLTLPGTPVLYYGDEIGMGDNVHLGDRDGVRTPMQWSSDRNGGFSRVDPEALVLPVIQDSLYGYESVNVEAQTRDTHSLLSWLRRMLAVRHRHKAFGRGGLTLLRPQNRKIFAYMRELDGELILCVANVSRNAEAVELDLAAFSGRIPIELSGGRAFPRIGQLPYLLTLPPFGFYWFLLSSEAEPPAWSSVPENPGAEFYTFVSRDGLADILEKRERAVLEKEILPAYLPARRWFQQKDLVSFEAAVAASARLSDDMLLTLVKVTAKDGSHELYVLPLAGVFEDEKPAPFESALALGRIRRFRRVGLLTDGFASAKFHRRLLGNFAEGASIALGGSALRFEAVGDADFTALASAEIEWSSAEQTNSSAIIGRFAVVKLLRRIVWGVHPELEMVRELSARGFTGIATLYGAVTLETKEKGSAAIAVLQRYIANQGDGFQWTLQRLDRLMTSAGSHDFEEDDTHFATYHAFALVLGQRLGELHRVLAEYSGNPDFAPETVDDAMIAAWKQRFAARCAGAFHVLAAHAQGVGGELLRQREAICAAGEAALDTAKGSLATRVHGDLHLGQVLVSGSDVVFIDFEGQPLTPLAERRAKASPLRDVAGILRSFDYAQGVTEKKRPASAPGASEGAVSPLFARFKQEAGSAFREGYEGARGAKLSPGEERLLTVFMLEKAAYEIVYEAQNRPDWIGVPLKGFEELARSIMKAQA